MTAALADPSIMEGEQTIPEFSDITPVPGPEPVAPADPAAPYGRTRSGAARGKPGPKKTTSTAAKKTASSSSPKKTAPSSSASARPTTPPARPTPPAAPVDPDAAPGPRAVALMRAVAPVVMSGGVAAWAASLAPDPRIARHGRAALADVGILAEVLPDLSQGLDEVAATRPNGRLSKLLDRVAEVSPYTRLINALTKVSGQVMANHGLVKSDSLVGRLLGVVDPTTLADEAAADIQAQVVAGMA